MGKMTVLQLIPARKEIEKHNFSTGSESPLFFVLFFDYSFFFLQFSVKANMFWLFLHGCMVVM